MPHFISDLHTALYFVPSSHRSSCPLYELVHMFDIAMHFLVWTGFVFPGFHNRVFHAETLCTVDLRLGPPPRRFQTIYNGVYYIWCATHWVEVHSRAVFCTGILWFRFFCEGVIAFGEGRRANLRREWVHIEDQPWWRGNSVTWAYYSGDCFSFGARIRQCT